jgi:hypothetical protein
MIFPRLFLRQVEILVSPTWQPHATKLDADILPALGFQKDDYGHGPVAARDMTFTHWGFAETLGPITSEAGFRLKDGAATFRIVRIRDWHGGYQLDLDEIRGG